MPKRRTYKLVNIKFMTRKDGIRKTIAVWHCPDGQYKIIETTYRPRKLMH